MKLLDTLEAEQINLAERIKKLEGRIDNMGTSTVKVRVDSEGRVVGYDTGRKEIKRVYIAGKLSDSGDTGRSPSKVVCEYITNLSNMLFGADDLVMLGFFPYVPRLDFLIGLYGGAWPEHRYRDLSMSFLEVCDAVLVISESDGVKAEIERANELGILVFYSLEELRRYNKGD